MLSNFATVTLALATGPLARFALLLAVVCAVGTIVLVAARHVFRWADAEVERHVRAALATEADDWGEPTREAVERLMDGDTWAACNGYGPAMCWGPASETPIFDATVADVAHREAADLDEEWRRISEATGGAA